MSANTGDKGTYNGMPVEVTKVHEDGKLDLQKVWAEGGAENLPWYERVEPDQFTPDEEPWHEGQARVDALFDEANAREEDDGSGSSEAAENDGAQNDGKV